MSSPFEAVIARVLATHERSGALPAGAGFGVAVARPDGPLFEGGFGLRDRARGLPVTPRTVFELGSATKALAASTALLAAEEGRLALDAPLAASGRALPLADPAVADRLTAADLLSHCTGLPPHDLLWYFAPPGRPRRELIGRLRHLELIPGGHRQAFAYNNLGYAALGALLEDVTGEPWERYAAGRFLEPLDMRGASFAPPAAGEADVAAGHVGARPVPRKDLGAIAPAGALRGTVEDLGRWLGFHLREGAAAGGAQLLARESVRGMHAPRIVLRERNPVLFQGLEWLGDDPAYALGWFVGRAFGRKALYHPAFIDGFSAALVLVPELAVGVAVVANLNVTPVPGRLARALLAAAAGEPPGPPAEAGEPPPAPPPAAPRAASPATRWVGRYEHPAYGALELAADGGSPVVRYGAHTWPLAFDGPAQATVTIPAFGFELPFPVTLAGEGGACQAVSLPLALDARVGPVTFTRAAG